MSWPVINNISSNRLYIYRTALEYAKDKILYGYGVKTTKVIWSLNRSLGEEIPGWIHNDFIELFTWFGLVGILIVCLVIKRVYRRGKDYYPRSKQVVGFKLYAYNSVIFCFFDFTAQLHVFYFFLAIIYSGILTHKN